MTEHKLAAMALIESIPDDKSAAVLKILQSVCELLNVNTDRNERLTARVEENLALMEEAESMVGEGGEDCDGSQTGSYRADCGNSR